MTITTQQQFIDVCDKITEETRSLLKLQLQRDNKIATIQEAMNPDIQALEKSIEQQRKAAEKFAFANKDKVFPSNKKTAESPLSIYSLRTGQPTLKPAGKGNTWAKIVEKLRAGGKAMSNFLIVDYKPDKEAIRHAKSHHAKIGVKVTQTERLNIEPKED